MTADEAKEVSKLKLNYSPEIITANRKMLKNPNGFVLGKPGQGKIIIIERGENLNGD